MSTLTESLATPHRFVHNGKAYSVSPITQKVKADFEQLLYSRAKASAADMKRSKLLEPDEYVSLLKQISDAYIRGEYSFEGTGGQAVLSSVPGVILLGSLLFNCSEQEMMQMILERQEEVREVVSEVIRESFPQFKDAEEADKKKESQILHV